MAESASGLDRRLNPKRRCPLRKRIILEVRTAAQTRKIGRLLGQLLEPGSVVALSGELGSGKTQFIKGLARGLGVNKRYQVSSPSFVLINEYPGKIPLYHLDLYRLLEGRALEEMGLEEYIYGNGVTAIEWAEKAASFLPPHHIWISLKWTGPNTRRLIISGMGKENVRLLKAIDRKSEGEG